MSPSNCQLPISNCRLEAAMENKAEELKKRTRNFAVRIVRLFRALPSCSEARVVGQQLLRSGTSVAANYRAACKARSLADFISKLGIVEEEADETEIANWKSKIERRESQWLKRRRSGLRSEE